MPSSNPETTCAPPAPLWAAPQPAAAPAELCAAERDAELETSSPSRQEARATSADDDQSTPAAEAADDDLDAGKRAAWIGAGILAGAPGALLGWLCYKSTPRKKKQALTCSVIGVVAGLGIALIAAGSALWALDAAKPAQTTSASQSISAPGTYSEISVDHDFRAEA